MLLYRLIKTKRTDDIIWLETIYWPLIGLPLILLQYFFFLNMNFDGAFAAAVKQSANAIFNLASALMIYYSFNYSHNFNRLGTKNQDQKARNRDEQKIPPKAREYLLLYINLSLIIPFFIAAFIFVRYEKTNILNSSKNEASFVMETLAKTLTDDDPFEPSRRFQLFGGFNVGLLDNQRNLLWATNEKALRFVQQPGRYLHKEGNVSIQISPSETNPMLSWRRSVVHAETFLSDNRILLIEQPFASAVAKMNTEITFSFAFLLLWLVASSSLARLFTNFLTNPLERLRLNAERLQRDPANEVVWPEFRIMEIKELRDSLVAMTGALMNRSIELKEAHRTALELLQQSERYLTFMGHELKAPISAMYSAIELLKEETANKSAVMEMIKDSSFNLIQLINDILDQSKARTGQLPFHNDFFVPMAEAHHCLETFIIQARRKGLEFVTVMDPVLNQPVWGDKLRFRQILTNLASNAIKYTDSGYIRLRIDGALGDSQCIQLCGTMEDSGRGIASDKLAYLWEPFAMAKGKLSETESSHGLGLSIVKAIIDALGGTIFVKSTLGSGSIFTFTFSLPLNMPENAAEISEPVVTHCTTSDRTSVQKTTTQANEQPDNGNASERLVQPLLAGIPTLVVDDERLSRMAIGYMLRTWGALVEETDSGESALQKIKDKDYRLIFLDQNMTGLTGLETARLVRELEKDSKRSEAIIILSSGDLSLQVDSEISIYLPKPVVYEELEKAVQTLNHQSLQISK